MGGLRFTSILAAAVLWTSCSRRESVLHVGQSIHHDDFEYTVESVDRTPRIADRRAAGLFYLVAFRVDNDARRVNHRWTNHVAYVVDAAGRRYESDLDLGRALAVSRGLPFRDQYVTPPDGTDRALLVFDLPSNVDEPYLMVRGSFLMGDVFDLGQYARARVRLF